MTFESSLSIEKNYENPICDGYDATTKMIESNIQNLINNFTNKSEVIFLIQIVIASHNQETITLTTNLLSQSNYQS